MVNITTAEPHNLLLSQSEKGFNCSCGHIKKEKLQRPRNFCEWKVLSMNDDSISFNMACVKHWADNKIKIQRISCEINAPCCTSISLTQKKWVYILLDCSQPKEMKENKFYMRAKKKLVRVYETRARLTRKHITISQVYYILCI